MHVPQEFAEYNKFTVALVLWCFQTALEFGPLGEEADLLFIESSAFLIDDFFCY